MRLVWLLRVVAVVVMAGGVAMEQVLRPGRGAGPVVVVVQLLDLVLPSLTLLGLAELRRFQMEVRDMLAIAGCSEPSAAGHPSHAKQHLWLVWVLRGLAGLLLVGMILEGAMDVSRGITLLMMVLPLSILLGLAAQAAAVAETLRLQIALRNALRVQLQAD